MRIIVDELPKKPSECVFSEYNCPYMECILKQDICELEKYIKCSMLLKHKKEGAE